jgi:hypothetical protein
MPDRLHDVNTAPSVSRWRLQLLGMQREKSGPANARCRASAEAKGMFR